MGAFLKISLKEQNDSIYRSECPVNAKTSGLDHLSPVLVDHFNFLTVNLEGCSAYSGEGWSMRVFYPVEC